MKTILNTLPGAAAVIGSVLGFLLGGFDGAVYTLLGFILIDYLTGVMTAIAQRQVSSEIGFVGILKKILILMMVALGHLLDQNLLGGGGAMRTAVIFFYTANEGISILENCARLGFPIPAKLKAVLAQLSEKEEK
ncbi:phage holin family protein [Acetobacterium tundrae]|uniref:Holin n=1 Tax=Acetobacterium tundrae TaxID=132932 RepID=A0ABR6WLS6_9FIRM|nr:phage holin family protein [Acetobacterium tundrae]MBC3797246.1 holin [Acetobacterium tundrae]